MIDKKTLLDALKYSFSNLLKFDEFVIKNEAHEQCVSGRIAMYIREYLIKLEGKNIRIDIEYNRDKNDPKCEDQSIPHEDKNPYIRPDILIHERGNNNNNILYCEIKKNNDCDIDKVKKQVYGDRKYQFGVDIYEISLQKIELFLFDRKNAVEVPEKYTFNCETIELELTNE